MYFGAMPIGLTIFEQLEEVEAQLRGGKWVRVSDTPPPSGKRRGYGGPLESLRAKYQWEERFSKVIH